MAAELAIAAYARDEDLLDAVGADGRARFRVEPVRDTLVVLGRGSKPELELHLDAIQADAVPLLRRRGGGCAVLLDPGNLVVSLVLPLPGVGDSPAAFAAASHWLIAALERIGAPGVEQRGVSDLAQGERKVGGACIYRSRGLLYYTTTLLIAPRLDLVARYLRHPPREPDYRRGRGHADFMGALERGSGDAVTAMTGRDLAQALAPQLDLGGRRVELLAIASG